MWITKCWTRKVASLTVPDRDLEIRGVPSHPDPLMGGGGQSLKNFFLPFGPQFGLKIRGALDWAPPLYLSG